MPCCLPYEHEHVSDEFIGSTINPVNLPAGYQILVFSSWYDKQMWKPDTQKMVFDSAIVKEEGCHQHAIDNVLTSHTAHVIVHFSGGNLTPSMANMVVCKHLHCHIYVCMLTTYDEYCGMNVRANPIGMILHCSRLISPQWEYASTRVKHSSLWVYTMTWSYGRTKIMQTFIA